MSVARPVNNPTPFATNSTQINTIPQTTTTNGAASMSAGFPPETMMPITSGGIPPDGKDFNGIFNQLSQHQVFLNAGGQYRFDATLASEIGGYPLGAVVQSNDGLSAYVSTIANNSHDPNTDMTGWEPFAGEALVFAGNNALTAEVARAEAAENALQTNINSEAATRASNDSTLQTNISNETARAEAEENNLQSQINSLSTSLTNETNRAKAEENHLQSEIDALSSSIANQYPKIIAAGFLTMTGSDNTANTTWTGTVPNSSYGGVDLTNTAKYILQPVFLGLGHLPDYPSTQIQWATSRTSTSFTCSCSINDSSPTVSAGTGQVSWSVIQLTA